MADEDRLLLCGLTFGVTIPVRFVCLCVWQLQILDGDGWGSASHGCQGLGLQGGRRRESHPQLHRLIPFHGMRWVGSYWVCPHRSLGFRGLYVWFAGAAIEPQIQYRSSKWWNMDQGRSCGCLKIKHTLLFHDCAFCDHAYVFFP